MTPEQHKEFLLDQRGNRVEVTPDMAAFRDSFPDIEDNARGVDPQQLCQMFVLTKNGGAFEFPPVPRIFLESGTAFNDLLRLHTSPETGGLARIKVEVCDAEPVINNAT